MKHTKNVNVNHNKVEIELWNNLHTSKTYGIILFPRKIRDFFPGYKIPSLLETDIGVLKVWVTSAPKGTKFGDPKAGKYISGLNGWYRMHKDLKKSDKIVIERIEFDRYKLYVEKRPEKVTHSMVRGRVYEITEETVKKLKELRKKVGRPLPIKVEHMIELFKWKGKLNKLSNVCWTLNGGAKKGKRGLTKYGLRISTAKLVIDGKEEDGFIIDYY